MSLGHRVENANLLTSQIGTSVCFSQGTNLRPPIVLMGYAEFSNIIAVSSVFFQILEYQSQEPNMHWASDSVLAGVPFFVFLWCGDMHRNYTFPFVFWFAYILCCHSECVRGQRPKNACVPVRLPNVNVYMVAGFGALALEGDDFLLASLAFQLLIINPECLNSFRMART